MTTKRRPGRPNKDTPADHAERMVIAGQRYQVWKRHYDTLGSEGKANEAAAKELRVTVKTIQNARKNYATEVEPSIQWWKKTTEANRSRINKLGEQLQAIKALLSAEELEEFCRMRTGARLIQRLLDGARAEKRVAELETKVAKLQSELSAAKATDAYSGKRNPR